MPALQRHAVIPHPLRQRLRTHLPWLLPAAAGTVLMASVVSIYVMGLASRGGAWAISVRPVPPAAADDPIGAALADGTSVWDRWEPGALIGAAASPGAPGVLATHTENTVYASSDDGRHFTQVLANVGEVEAIAVDRAGTIYAVRDRHLLGTAPYGAAESWQALPYASETLALATGAGTIAWLHVHPDDDDGLRAMLALSGDGGATWRFQVVPAYGNVRNDLRIDSDGTIELLALSDGDDTDEQLIRYRGHIDGRPLERLPWPAPYPGGYGLGRGGWAYAVASECGDAGRVGLCAIAPGRPAAVHAATYVDDFTLHVGANDRLSPVPRTLAVAGRDLLRLTGDRARSIGTPVPGRPYAIGVDGIGRALVVSGDTLLRWSPAWGWRRLLKVDR